MVVVHLIMNYDMALADEKASRVWSWRSAMVPRAGVEMVVRKRA